MADEQQRSRPVEKHLLEQLQRLDVEIVGRLVEHQHVRRACEQAREQQPVALAARQRTHRREGPFGWKQELLQIPVHVLRLAVHEDSVAAVGDGVEHGTIGIELLALLIVVDDLDAGAAPHLALVWRQLADQQPQECRLAGPVRPDQPDPIAPRHPYRQVADDGLAAKRFGHAFGLEHRLTRALRERRLQAHVAGSRAARGALLPHLRQRLDPSFVPRAPCLDALTQPRFFLGKTLGARLRSPAIPLSSPESCRNRRAMT